LNRVEYLHTMNEITDWDNETLTRLVSTQLSEQAISQIINPPFILEREKYMMALHWHPEIVPNDLLSTRINAMFPSVLDEIIIPTQHNDLVSWDSYSGVEVDSYSKEFNRKVQLLFHFDSNRLEHAHTFKSMLSHTYKYRASQFFDFLETLTNPTFKDRIAEAVAITELDKETLDFVQVSSAKLKMLIDRNFSDIPEQSIKNKLIPAWFQELKEFYEPHLVNRAIIFLKTVKEIVKSKFVLTYFYETQEVIEETRALGCGIVIPHPEQFWPILLADYDVDGYEVWNPQSREFSEFLIQTVIKKNQTLTKKKRSLLVFMGDDTHMSEKIKELDKQEPEKAKREIGYQPAWEDPAIQKSLVYGQFDKKSIILEYKARLLNPQP